MTWYGLKVNGELVDVIPWKGRSGEPTVFDFDVPLIGSDYYDVVEVLVEEAPRDDHL